MGLVNLEATHFVMSPNFPVQANQRNISAY